MSGVPELADYKYGFHEDVTPVYETGMGLSEEVVRTISQVKNEPQWMLDFRLKSLKNVIVWKRKKKNVKLRFVVPRKRRINVNKEAYYGCLFWTNSRTSYRKRFERS